eukprot:gene38973-51252_t
MIEFDEEEQRALELLHLNIVEGEEEGADLDQDEQNDEEEEED